jgi:hypothetical protein
MWPRIHILRRCRASSISACRRGALADRPHLKSEGPTTDQRGIAPLLQLDACASAVRHQHADAMCRTSENRAIIR